MKAIEQAKKNGDEVEACIMSTFKKYSGKESVYDGNTGGPSAANPSPLKSITKSAKNTNNS